MLHYFDRGLSCRPPSNSRHVGASAVRLVHPDDEAPRGILVLAEGDLVFRHGDLDPLLLQGTQRTHNGIVLQAAGDGVASDVEQAFDDQIQGFRGVGGEDNVGRIVNTEELG